MLIPSLLVLALSGAPTGALPTPQDGGYEELDQAYEKAALDWRRAQRKARKAKQDFDEPHPIHAFYPRFEAFAEEGEPAARLWIGLNVEDLGLSMAATGERKRAAFTALVRQAADDPELMKRFLLKIDRQAKWLEDEELLKLLQPVYEKSPAAEQREEAAFKIAQRYERIGTEAGLAQAEAWYEKILADFPDSKSASRAKDLLVGMNVAVGRIAPDFETEDVDGTAFKLSDYRGKVVVVDFWGFW